MINLLPPDIKKGYKFARINVSLRRWVFCCAIALVGLAALGTYGLATLHQSVNQYNSQIASSQQLLTKEHYTQAQEQVKQISDSFRLMVKVLSQEVLFSEVLQQVAQAIPNNADLTGLNIAQYGGALDISASAADYQTATQLQVNLSNAGNKIFAKADIESINCSSNTSSTNSRYPCTVTVRALFAQNNPFLFIHSNGAGV